VRVRGRFFVEGIVVHGPPADRLAAQPPAAESKRPATGTASGADYKRLLNADVCAHPQIANSKVLIQLADRVEFTRAKVVFCHGIRMTAPKGYNLQDYDDGIVWLCGHLKSHLYEAAGRRVDDAITGVLGK
jgi:hypothetical protein